MRLLPYPFASAALLVLWLLLQQSVSPGHILLGSVVALVGGLALSALEPPKLHVRRWAAVLKLTGRVSADIIRSNIAVAAIIGGFARRKRVSGFVEIPIKLRDPYGLAVLACIITSTPGTVWGDFDSATGTLTIHVLDLADSNDWIRTVQERYERLLLEIFA
jgi:multicomponent K+:H+ antiporter subunit E